MNFRDEVLARVRVTGTAPTGAVPEVSSEVRDAMHAAVGHATRRHDEAANGMHLLDILAQPGTAFHAWMQRHGGQLERLREMLDSNMQYDNTV